MSRLALTPTNVPALSAAPSTPTLRAGDLYYNTTDGLLYVYSGTAWVGSSAPSPSSTVVAETSFGSTSSAGSAGTFSRGDHTHGTPSLSSTTPVMDGTAAVGTGTTAARSDHVHPSDTTRAPLASPTFTGIATFVNVNLGYTTTATAGATTTLTATSTNQQYFTGTSNQTVQLPVTSTLALGVRYRIVNNSTGVITINSSGGNLVATIPPNNSYAFTCILASGTTAASWDAEWNGSNSITGTGANVLATSPTLTTPNIGVATGTSFNSITGLSSTNPAALGAAAVGTGTTTARADHVHPTTGLGLTSGTLAQFAATTSAQLAGVISDETGSGVLVFATSPALAGTPTAPTAAAGTNTTQIATTAFTTDAVTDTKIISETLQTITANETLTTGYNGMSVGPVTINNGITVTVPSGAVWVVF